MKYMYFTFFIVLFILKVGGLVTWSWWLITFPIWIIPVFAVVAGLILSWADNAGMIKRVK